MFARGGAPAGDASHKAKTSSALRVGWAGGCVISRGDEKNPDWYLSLLTADIKDPSLAEQKGKNIIFGLIWLFSLSKYRRLQRG